MLSKLLYILFMALLGIGLVAGAGVSLVMIFTESWIWIIPAVIGLTGSAQVLSFFVSMSDPANGSKGTGNDS